MEVDPTRMCELLVGLADLDVVGVEDVTGCPIVVHVRSRLEARRSAHQPRSTIPLHMPPPGSAIAACATPTGSAARSTADPRR